MTAPTKKTEPEFSNTFWGKWALAVSAPLCVALLIWLVALLGKTRKIEPMEARLAKVEKTDSLLRLRIEELELYKHDQQQELALREKYLKQQTENMQRSDEELNREAARSNQEMIRVLRKPIILYKERQ